MDRTTISFHVFLDERNEAQENSMGGHTVLKVTLTGNSVQMQGFICLFFAQYGTDGLRSNEFTGDLKKYHQNYFHDYIDSAHLMSLDQRYVISLTELQSGYGLQFLTSHLEDFVSGMEVVPPKIVLREQAQHELAATITEIEPQYVQENWKEVYNFLDLEDPDQCLLYTEGKVDDPFAHASFLSTINTTSVTPLTVSIERCQYVTPVLAIGQYLDRYDHGKIPNLCVATLEIAYLEESWQPVHSRALAEICHRLKVKDLYCLRYDVEDAYYESLAKHSKSDRYQFLPELKMVEIFCTDVVTNFWDLIHNSNARKLIYRIQLLRNEQPFDQMYRTNSILIDVYDNNILDNYRIRELLFYLPGTTKPVTYEEINATRKLTHKQATVLRVLKRNQRAFEKCVKAVVILLGIRKKRLSVLDRDSFSVVIGVLWKTRSTESWA